MRIILIKFLFSESQVFQQNINDQANTIRENFLLERYPDHLEYLNINLPNLPEVVREEIMEEAERNVLYRRLRVAWNRVGIHATGLDLWQFLMRELDFPEHNNRSISWTAEDGSFQIIDWPLLQQRWSANCQHVNVISESAMRFRIT